MKDGVRERSKEISSRLKTRDFAALLADGPESAPEAGASGDRFGFENAEYVLIDPGMVELQGDYVRTPEEVEADPEFDAFVDAIADAGKIEQPAGVRTVGAGWEKKYVLVWGMRRWRAALRLGMKLPVVDKGTISEDEAYALQMRENENRSDPRPVQIALGYYRWVQRGRSQNQVARESGKNKSYVSYMRAVGEALATLSAEERGRLAASALATVRRFQDIAKLDGVEARTQAVRGLLVSAPRPQPEQPRGAIRVSAQQTRTGRRVRMEWSERDLKRDPAAVMDAIQSAFVQEQRQLVERLNLMADQAEARHGGRSDARRFRDAAERAQRILDQVDQTRT